LKNVYEEFAGTGFEYLVDCTRDVDMCNARRFADGGKNHSHPLEIELPKRFDDAATYAEAIELRDQCKRLGLSLTTGVVHDVKERCAIYRQVHHTYCTPPPERPHHKPFIASAPSFHNSGWKSITR
jgi:hypothetical protein